MGVQVQGAADASLIVCSHLPGEGHFESDRFTVVPALCEDEYDYWAALNVVWSSDVTIVNLEHDLEVSDAHIAALLDCPYGACAWAYRCHWASSGIPGGVIAAGRGERRHGGTGDPRYLQGGEHWAAWAAIGLVKIVPAARIAPLRREPWQNLELAVHDATERPWHIHWTPELKHHHWAR